MDDKNTDFTKPSERKSLRQLSDTGVEAMLRRVLPGRDGGESVEVAAFQSSI